MSPAGGAKPTWARNGRELFYVATDGALMSVPVEATATAWSNGAAVKLLEMRSAAPGAFRSYDVSSDGRRFLLIRTVGTEQGTSANMIVVQHFDEELKRLVPTR